MAIEITGYGHQKFNCAEPRALRDILTLCSNMAASFDKSVAWEENGLINNLSCNSRNDSALDVSGLTKLSSLERSFQESYDAYPFGEELIQEYVMYGLGVPFSRAFLPKVCLVLADRFRCVPVLSHQETIINDSHFLQSE